MAKVQNNIFVRGLSGSLGDQFVVRKGKAGNTVISNKPVFSPQREFNASQLAHQDAFREAIAYAKTAKDEEVYLTKAQGTTMSAFNAAVADWFNKPQVLEIDTNGWTGAIGETIRIKAMDDTLVIKVHVVITDASNAVLEQGDAVQADGLWWNYTTTTTIATPATARMVATAEDMPGNSAELAWQN